MTLTFEDMCDRFVVDVYERSRNDWGSTVDMGHFRGELGISKNVESMIVAHCLDQGLIAQTDRRLNDVPLVEITPAGIRAAEAIRIGRTPVASPAKGEDRQMTLSFDELTAKYMEMVYGESNGNPGAHVAMLTFIEDYGIAILLAYEIKDYCVGQGWVKDQTTYGGGPVVSIKAEGIRAVEAMRRKSTAVPGVPGQPASIHINIQDARFDVTHSAVAIGSPGATQTVTGSDLTEVTELVRSMLTSLDGLRMAPDLKAEVRAALEDLQREAREGRVNKVKSALKKVVAVVTKAGPPAIILASRLPELQAMLG